MLKPSEKQLLASLRAALPGLRASVVLAETIATCPAQRGSRHPVLNFSFARAPATVWENTLLRMAEAVVLIDTACLSLRQESLFAGRGRDRSPVDPDFAACIRLRDQLVAHRARMLDQGVAALNTAVARHASMFGFLLAIVDKVQREIQRLADDGLLKPAPTGSSVEAPLFSMTDVTRLVEAANALVTKASA